jgi:catechol 2,3-dioxygenase-like lactoylglutathione lyase family enzyme
MHNALSLITFMTDEYDPTIEWFQHALRFHLLEDTDKGGGKRWVRMAAQPDATHAILIGRATTDAQRAAIGNQHGGRVGFFLETDDFDAMHKHMLASGVTFREKPRFEPYGIVAVFEDLHGAPWDLLQYSSAAGGTG